ncbi:MAG: response regulator [Gemmatimonadota bacterium]|nr:response regulator [Gemmatimonadota bacterium]
MSSFSDSQVVLVVDDDPVAREILGILCVRRGYQPVFAHSVEEAAEKLSAYPVDILVTDSALPDGSVLPLVKMVRSTFYLMAMPIIILSRQSGIDDLPEITGLGVERVLQKPVVAADVEAALVHAFEKAPPQWEGESEVRRRLGLRRHELADLLSFLKTELVEVRSRVSEARISGRAVDAELRSLILRTRSAALNVGGHGISRLLDIFTTGNIGAEDMGVLDEALSRAIHALTLRLGEPTVGDAHV